MNIDSKLNDVEVVFILPFDNRRVVVELSKDLTPREIIRELADADFLPNGDYFLAKKGGSFIADDTAMSESGVLEGDVFHIIPPTCAG